MDPYDELGVDRTATVEEINGAYRRRARRHHPDAGGDQAAFARLQMAVSILRDPARRARYDQTGALDDTAGNEQAKALNLVVLAFASALKDGTELGKVDIVRAADAHLAKLLDEIAGERAKVQAATARIADALQRLSHDGSAPDVVRRALEIDAAKMARAPIDLDERESAIVAARDLAQAYRWTLDPAVEAVETNPAGCAGPP